MTFAKGDVVRHKPSGLIHFVKTLYLDPPFLLTASGFSARSDEFERAKLPKGEKFTWEVTHRILREEFLTVRVKAGSEAEAIKKAGKKIEKYSTADYEPGDVVEDDGDGFEAVPEPFKG